VEHLLRKAIVREWSCPKREFMCTPTSKVTGKGLLKPLEVYLTTVCPGCQTELEDLMLALLSFSLALVLLSVFSFLCYGIGMFILPLYVGSM
jgi:hypothetical protein